MDDQLPGINQSQRIEITEDELTARSPSNSIKSSQTPPAPSPAAEKLPALSPRTPPAPTPAGKHPDAGSYCSGCGSAIHPQAVVCPRCGVATVSAAQATGAAMNVALNAKSTGLAILLSLVFTGAGHWYVGRIGRGIAFFAAAFISGLLIFALIGLFTLPIVWVWAAIDANKCAQQHNQMLLAQAGTPVSPAVLSR